MSDTKSTPEKLIEKPSAASLFAGVARCDITPPNGIYGRMWGAAKHDLQEGVHQPISATVLAISDTVDGTPLLLVSIDLCVIGNKPDERLIRDPLIELVGGDEARVMVCCTHTHGIGFFSTKRSHLPGGDKIAPYFQKISKDLREAAEQAIVARQAATLTWATSSCSLASNRDLPDPNSDTKRYLTGYNPAKQADETLLVGRVTRNSDQSILASIVNYACHPTTLAWENRLASPDFVGSMREVVEGHTGDAPCLFLQGASGELAPRHQYVGDHKLPEKHGRQLGHAVMSAIESMNSPGTALAFIEEVKSGAPLAVWREQPIALSNVVNATFFDVPLPKRDWPTADELRKQLEECEDRTIAERLTRKLHLVENLGDGPIANQPAWVWQLGTSLLIAQPNECYSDFQIALRAAFPEFAVAVMNVTNGSVGYIYPADIADEEIYPVWQSPFQRDALTTLTDRCVEQAKRLLA